MTSKWPPVPETFYEDGEIPDTKPDAVNVVAVKLRAAVRDEMYKTNEQRLCSDRRAVEESDSLVMQLLYCSEANGVEVLMSRRQPCRAVAVFQHGEGCRGSGE